MSHNDSGEASDSQTRAQVIRPGGCAAWKDMPHIKLLLLDRDGVINEDVGAPGVLLPSQLQLTRNAGRAIARLKQQQPSKQNQMRVVVVTNQSCVSKGLITNDELTNIHESLQEKLLQEDSHATLDQIYACTSLRNSGDVRMKPNPGMILEALEDASKDGTRTTPDQCLLVGDAVRDLQAAAAAGVRRRILVQTGYGFSLMGNAAAPEATPEMDGAAADNPCGLWIETSDCLPTNSNPDTFPDSVFPFLYVKNLETAIAWIMALSNLRQEA